MTELGLSWRDLSKDMFCTLQKKTETKTKSHLYFRLFAYSFKAAFNYKLPHEEGVHHKKIEVIFFIVIIRKLAV